MVALPDGGGEVVVQNQDCTDTEDMFQKYIARLQRERLLPPAHW